GDPLAGLDRVGEAPRALIHVAEAARIGQEIADLRFAVAGEIVARHTAGEQQFVDQLVEPRAGLGRAAPAPWLAAGRLFDSKREGHAPVPSSSSRNSRAAALGIAGMEWPVDPPPATPKRRVAVPNQRVIKFSLRSMLWILATGRMVRLRRHQPPRISSRSSSSAKAVLRHASQRKAITASRPAP